MNVEDFVVGAYVWFEGSGACHTWSCPCVITEVDRDAGTFSFRSFDDMKHHEDNSIEHRVKSGGMRVIAEKEARRYFEDLCTAKHRDAEDAREKFEVYSSWENKVFS